MFVTMVVAALLVDGLVNGSGADPDRVAALPHGATSSARSRSTTTVPEHPRGRSFAAMFWLTARRGATDTDPMCRDDVRSRREGRQPTKEFSTARRFYSARTTACSPAASSSNPPPTAPGASLSMLTSEELQ